MTLEEIEKLWLSDSQIDKANLTQASLNIPKLHQKYYSFLIGEQKVLQKLNYELSELTGVLERYYSRNMTMEELEDYGFDDFPDTKILKPDVPKWIERHDDVIKTKIKIGLQNIKIDYLKSILKEASNMSFQIRNVIEWEKFKAGEF